MSEQDSRDLKLYKGKLVYHADDTYQARGSCLIPAKNAREARRTLEAKPPRRFYGCRLESVRELKILGHQVSVRKV